MDSNASHHLTFDLDNLAIHSKYISNKKVVTGNGKTFGIFHISSFTMQANYNYVTLFSILRVLYAFQKFLSIDKLT